MKTILFVVSMGVLSIPFTGWGEEEKGSRLAGAGETARELLRDGLFEEEANGNFEKAEAAYRTLIERYDQERRYAGTAMFRLAEIARKRDENEKAATLFARVASEFADQAELAARARGKLKDAGVLVSTASPADPDNLPIANEEAVELARLKGLRAKSPDLLDGVDKEGLYPLHHAAMNGWAQAIDFLLAQKVRVDSLAVNGNYSPLHLAVIHGHLDAVKKLIAAGADMNATFQRKGADLPVPPPRILRSDIPINWSPLHLAVLYDRREVAAALLHTGAKGDSDGVHLELVIMSESGGRSRQTLGSSATPLILALWLGNEKMTRFLLEKGMDPNQVVKQDGNSPLMTAVRRSPQLLPLLFEKGMKVNEIPYFGRTALLHAVLKPQSGALQILVAKGANVNAVVEKGAESESDIGIGVLEWAVREARHLNEIDGQGNPVVSAKEVRFLLGKGAKPRPPALQRAVKGGHLEIVEALLDAGGDVNAVGPGALGAPDSPVLHVATSAAMAKLLIERGANVEAKNSLGETPLEDLFHKSGLGTRETELVELLLEKGADPSVLELTRPWADSEIVRPTLPALAPYFLERFRYQDSLKANEVQVAFPFQGRIVVTERKQIEGTVPPSLAELLIATMLRGVVLTRETPLDLIRVFRLVGAELQEVQRIEADQINGETTLALQWGDLVEIQVGGTDGKASSRSSRARPISRLRPRNPSESFARSSVSDVIKRCKHRRLTMRIGAWEEKFTIYFSHLQHGLYLKDHLPDSSRVADLSTVRVIRGGEVLELDCRLGAIRNDLRLVDGDVIEIPLRKTILESPDQNRWDGVTVLYPDLLSSEKPSGQAGVIHASSLFGLLSGSRIWPKNRDFSKVEILRVSSEGKVEKIMIDLTRKLEEIPRFNWSRKQLLVLDVQLLDGDLVVLPPMPKSNWAGQSSGTRGLSGVIRQALDFLEPPKDPTAKPARVRPPAIRALPAR